MLTNNKNEDIKDLNKKRTTPSASVCFSSENSSAQQDPPKKSTKGRPSSPLWDTTVPKSTRAGRFHDKLKARGLISCLSPCSTKTHNTVEWEKEFILLEKELVVTFNLSHEEAHNQVNEILDVYANKYGVIKYLPKALNGKDFRSKYLAIRKCLLQNKCIEDDDQFLMGEQMEEQVHIVRIQNEDGTISLKFRDPQ